MTDLSARLKQLKKAMTPGPWTWRGGAPQFYGLEGKDSQDVLRPLDGAVYSEYSSDSATIQIRCDEDAAVIALGDLFIPLAMALDEVVTVWDSPKMLALWERTATLGQYDGPIVNMDNIRVLLAQIAERLT